MYAQNKMKTAVDCVSFVIPLLLVMQSSCTFLNGVLETFFPLLFC